MKKNIEILITGDFYGGYRIEKLIREKKYDLVFNDFLPLLQKADITITNLESPLISNGKPILKTGPAIKADPETIEALKFAGINLIALANNHILDYGPEGLMETIDLCTKHNIATVGAGKNKRAASETFFRKIDGITIAFINVAENEWSTTVDDNPGAHPLNPVANYYKINDAQKNADFVFMIVHGGHETYELPSPRMKETYRFFVDAGADAVIGHHTHCFSGYEIYKNKPIFYSLGNFIFDSSSTKHESWHYGFAVNFKLPDNKTMLFEILPYEQWKGTAGVQLLKNQSKAQFTEKLRKLSVLISDDDYLNDSFKKFVRDKLYKTYNAFLEPHSIKPLRMLQSQGMLPSLLSKRKRKLYLNLIRCEAHRDVLSEILKNDSNSK